VCDQKQHLITTFSESKADGINAISATSIFYLDFFLSRSGDAKLFQEDIKYCGGFFAEGDLCNFLLVFYQSKKKVIEIIINNSGNNG
jgi:hypothetical protein